MDLPFQELRKLRELCCLTQEDLAELSGVPLAIVRDIEAGVMDVSSEHVERIHQTLRTEAESLSLG